MSAALAEDSLAPWSEWNAEEYLSEYYGEVMADEKFALEFLVESMRQLPKISVALDFGCGPTVHHLFPLVPKVQELHMAEYLSGNREQVSAWLAGASNAHDWRAFSLETLALEGSDLPTDVEAHAREQETRKRITCVLPADAGDLNPLGPERRGFYDLVTTHYCAEGATNDKAVWAQYMSNIASLVKPGGWLLLSACGAADFYQVGDRRFPCAGVTAMDVLGCLAERGFTDIDLRVRQVSDHSDQGYSSVIFAFAKMAASALAAEAAR